MNRLKQFKWFSGIVAFNTFVAICFRIGDAFFVSRALAGTTSLVDALNFVVDYWATDIFFWATLCYLVCTKLEKWTSKFLTGR